MNHNNPINTSGMNMNNVQNLNPPLNPSMYLINY